MNPPKYLDKVAREFWREHQHQTTDYHTLQLLSDAFSTWKSAQALLAEQQKLVSGDEINPYFLLVEKAQNAYCKLLKAAKLQPAPPPKPTTSDDVPTP